MFRTVLSKHTFCEHEQCSLINLAFQLVCRDSLGLMVLWVSRSSMSCSVMDRDKRGCGFAGRTHQPLSAFPAIPSLLPELLRLVTVGTAEGADKMGCPLGHFPEPGLLWIVKWLS